MNVDRMKRYVCSCKGKYININMISALPHKIILIKQTNQDRRFEYIVPILYQSLNN